LAFDVDEVLVHMGVLGEEKQAQRDGDVEAVGVLLRTRTDMVPQNTYGREANGRGKPYRPLFSPFLADRSRCEDMARSFFATTMY
jgi:hypothetical protein